MLEEMERAVRAKGILIESHAKYKERIEKIKHERNELLLLMTTCLENSIQRQDIERQIEALDQKEFEVYHKYKKILQAADKEINESVTRIVQRRFGPNFDCDSIAGNAPNND